MIGTPTLLRKINLDPPYAKIYARLGYKKKTTDLPPDQRDSTDRHIRKATSIIDLSASCLRLDIDRHDPLCTHLNGNVVFNSANLATFLQNCSEAVLMGATAGNDIMNIIRDATAAGEMTAAVIYDATASEMTDAALDWLMDYINRMILREGKALLPRRFSPGYGDFHLSNQTLVHDRLRLIDLGVALSAKFILLPEKSVTAVGGIVSHTLRFEC